jgi:hypothetical protein
LIDSMGQSRVEAGNARKTAQHRADGRCSGVKRVMARGFAALSRCGLRRAASAGRCRLPRSRRRRTASVR